MKKKKFCLLDRKKLDITKHLLGLGVYVSSYYFLDPAAFDLAAVVFWCGSYFLVLNWVRTYQNKQGSGGIF